MANKKTNLKKTNRKSPDYDGKGIENVIDVENELVTSIAQFEEIYDKWNDQIFHSMSAEKNRFWIKRKKINIYFLEEESRKKFETMVRGQLYNVTEEKELDLISEKKYITAITDSNIHKVFIDLDNCFYEKVFIHKDTIYTDSLRMVFKKKKTILYVEKRMKSAFPIRSFSINADLARFRMNSEWRDYIYAIMEGLSQ